MLICVVGNYSVNNSCNCLCRVRCYILFETQFCYSSQGGSPRTTECAWVKFEYNIFKNTCTGKPASLFIQPEGRQFATSEGCGNFYGVEHGWAASTMSKMTRRQSHVENFRKRRIENVNIFLPRTYAVSFSSCHCIYLCVIHINCQLKSRTDLFLFQFMQI